MGTLYTIHGLETGRLGNFGTMDFNTTGDSRKDLWKVYMEKINKGGKQAGDELCQTQIS